MKTKLIRTHVKWVDSVGPSRYWEHRDDVDHSVSHIETVGWLVHENKKSVTIASSVSKNSGCYGGILTIPKFAITKREDG